MMSSERTMNFASSTQRTQWRFAPKEISRRRHAARDRFVAALVKETQTMQPAPGASASAAPTVGVKRGSPEQQSAPSAESAASAAAPATATVISLPLSVDDEQVVLRSWMSHIDGWLQRPDSPLQMGPFVRASTWLVRGVRKRACLFVVLCAPATLGACHAGKTALSSHSLLVAAVFALMMRA